MKNPGFNRGTAASSLLVLLVGCTEGALDQPRSPKAAMELQVHLVEAPPDVATEVALQLAEIPYCPRSDVPAGLPPRPPTIEDVNSFWRPLDRTASIMTVTAASGGNQPAFHCIEQTTPLVRFFQVDLFVSPQSVGGPLLSWTSRDTLVAYVDEAATFTPFGPADQPIALSPGYSILRRTCGTGGLSWQLQVGAPGDVIDFYPPTATFYPQPSPLASALLEQSERALLPDCGIAPPAPDLGLQVSFDRAASLAFSSTGQELLVLLPIDGADPGQGAPLRSIDLASGKERQLGVVPDGRSLQTISSGDTYVTAEISVLKAAPRADGSTVIEPLPWPGTARVSPDGRWFSSWGASRDPQGGIECKIWEVATGVSRTLGRPFFPVGWSPGSQLIVDEETEQGIVGYALLDPTDGLPVERFAAPTTNGFYLRLVWGADAPVLLGAPTIWTPQQPVARSNQVIFSGRDELDFGLVTQDLRSGVARAVLAPLSGRVSYAASSPGMALVWARTCLGLFETVCSFELHQVTLATGADQIVAVTDSAAPVAVSPAGDRIAIAARYGIHVRTLP